MTHLKLKSNMVLKVILVIFTVPIYFNFVRGNVTNEHLSEHGEYIGCYEGDCLSVDDRPSFTWNAVNPPEACIETCERMGFIYAGLYHRSICICSRYNRCDKHENITDDNKPGLPCLGNAASCGGVTQMAVYRLGKHMGYYPKDCLEIANVWNVANSPDTCTQACGVLNFTYAGLYNRHMCVCSGYNPCHVNEEGKCGVPCPGDEYKFCGGIGWMAVYKKPYIGITKGVISILGALAICAVGIAMFFLTRRWRGQRSHLTRASYSRRMHTSDLSSDPTSNPSTDSHNRHATETVQSQDTRIPVPNRDGSPGNIPNYKQRHVQYNVYDNLERGLCENRSNEEDQRRARYSVLDMQNMDSEQMNPGIEDDDQLPTHGVRYESQNSDDNLLSQAYYTLETDNE